MTLSFFILKKSFGVLDSRSLCGAETGLLFRKARSVRAFQFKLVPFCSLSPGLGSTNKSATSLSCSSHQTLALLLLRFPLVHSSFYLSFTGTSGRNYPFFRPLFYQNTISFRSHILPGNDMADELGRQGTLLQPSTIPCIYLISPFTSTLLFSSNWRPTVPSKFFDTQVPQYSQKT